MNEIDLTGKRALVTGASRGIGRAVAERLAGAGARVAVNYLRRRDAADEVAAAIRAGGGECLVVRGNVADPEHVERVVSEVAGAWGGIDVVVSNAATGVLRPALELTRKHLQVTMETNAFALVELARGAAPHMGEGGRMLAMTSLGGTRAIPDTANAISAGVVETEALDFFPARDAILAESRRRTPSGRLVTPDEVADVALFLCSPLARAITGQTIVVDNGYSTIA
jgi:enoyl-[acyl-carrier protein] reductase III